MEELAMPPPSVVPLPGLQIHSDGSTTRTAMGIPMFDDCPADPDNSVVASMDVVLVEDQQGKLGARLYLPVHDKENPKRVPVVLYFHGGGFVLCSSRSAGVHKMLEAIAAKLRVIIISVDYRLAPEHRLPAAYEDAARSLDLLDAIAAGEAKAEAEAATELTSARPWLEKYADIKKVILMGDSAGANICQYVARTWWPEQQTKQQLHLEIVGLVLLQPFFGGESRSRSEVTLVDILVPQPVVDTFWAHALPLGTDRDHPFCNPFPHLGRFRLPKSLVVVGGKDPLRDRGVEFARALVDAADGNQEAVRLVEYENVGHGFYGLEDAVERALLLDELAAWVEHLK